MSYPQEEIDEGYEPEYPTWEEEKTAELRLDQAAEEERREDDRAAELRYMSMEPDERECECEAEFIGGSYSYCGCHDCCESDDEMGFTEEYA